MGSKINFYSENQFQLKNSQAHLQWIERVMESEGKRWEELSYIFCDDEYLLNINMQYLDHDTYTDIITFDYTIGNALQGEIYISTERVVENALKYNVNFEDELRRVLVHGILHLCGYKDKTEDDAKLMRQKEEEKMQLFHVEQ
ncbi:rRNA maturation RNase YbeY [Gillisia sp. M10.2A]|uniref:Endoribonuclease YbeY n=1 Tax=Gillisia lutea TaxID=2909668 RepID=A0ABS9EEF2_9FLAO|nr:rRNA maturation RNase YbeY [Gillisia lutea]MCF4100642.1 rRNA maturation RNase YbeY [Gillisia lutea]